MLLASSIQLDAGVIQDVQELGEGGCQAGMGHFKVADRFFEAADLPLVAAQVLFVTGPLEQVADIDTQVAEKLTPLLVDGISPFNPLVKLFQQFAELVVVHGKQSPSQDELFCRVRLFPLYFTPALPEYKYPTTGLA
jgi:hypothetical protein